MILFASQVLLLCLLILFYTRNVQLDEAGSGVDTPIYISTYLSIYLYLSNEIIIGHLHKPPPKIFQINLPKETVFKFHMKSLLCKSFFNCTILHPSGSTLSSCRYTPKKKQDWNETPKGGNQNLHMVCHIPFHCICQVWDALEICCGEALLSRCLRFGDGLQVGAFDVLDWEPYAQKRGLPCQTNPLDMATPAGMAFLTWKWQFTDTGVYIYIL